MGSDQLVFRARRRDLFAIGLLTFGAWIVAAGVDWAALEWAVLWGGVVAISLVAMWRFDYALILALFGINNPILNFHMLSAGGFGSGQIRFMVSLACIAGLAVGLLVRMAMRRERRVRLPYDRAVAILAVTIIGGTAVGFARGNDIREIIAEAFPYLEGCAYYFLACYAFRERRQIQLLLVCLFVWTLVCHAFDIRSYFISGNELIFKVQTDSGILLARLVNFMITLSIPALFVYLILVPRGFVARLMIYIAVASGMLILVLGSFRSIWIGLAMAAMYACYQLRTRIRFGRLLLAVPAVVLAIYVCDALLSSSRVLGGLSIMEILQDRFSSHALYEGSSYLGRLEAFHDLFIQSFSAPIIGHGLGAYFVQGMRVFPVSSSPNLPLNLLYSLGFIGFVLVAGCAWSIFRRTANVYAITRDPEVRALSLAVSAAMVSFFGLSNLFPTLLHVPMLAYLAVACAAVGADFQLSSSTPSSNAAGGR